MMRLMHSAILLYFLLLLPAISIAQEDNKYSKHIDNDTTYQFIKNYDTSQENSLDFPLSYYNMVDLRYINISHCHDTGIGIDSCRVGLCYQDTPFGKTYRKVSGVVDNHCRYIERSREFGGINCVIPMHKLQEFSELIEKHYDAFNNPTHALSEEEAAILTEMYQQMCDIVPERELRSLITMPNHNYYRDELTDLIDSPNHRAMHANNISPPEDKEQTQKKQRIKLDPYGSVMFRQEDAELILSLVQGEGDPLLGQEGGYRNRQSSIAFYLNSILYVSQDNWMLWLNNHKFGAGETADDSNITVNNVTPDGAEFTWWTKNIDRVIPNWRNRTREVDTNSYTSIDGKVKIALHNDESSSITFSLNPNQTFVINSLSVIEGKVQ